MENIKVRVLNLILFIDFIMYIFSNLIIFKYSPSTLYSIFALCIRDVIIFLFSIFVYLHFCNSKISSIILFPKINGKIVKNSIIIGTAFYFISNGANVIFRNIFKFTMKQTVYLNNMYDLYNFGFGFLFYLFVHTIFTELLFRGILNDAFKFLKYRDKIILTAFIFAIFFFGPSQFFYGFILGILLMEFYNRIGNIGPVIISSWFINILNYLVNIGAKLILKESVTSLRVASSKDVFINFLFPLIVILIGLIVYSIYRDKINIKKRFDFRNNSNVTVINFRKEFVNIFDIYFMLFLVSVFFMMTFSYIFLG